MKILVLGDLILDVYTHCGCERISPEAPVPVLLPQKSERKLGGAANVALGCAALGAQVHCASVVGADEAAKQLQTELETAGIKAILLADNARKTSLKERLLASGKQVARLDYESTEQISQEKAQKLLALCDERYDAVIISDYAKGCITSELIDGVKKRSDLVLADPKNDLNKLKGCSIITPNLKEARAFAGEFNASDDAQLLRVLQRWRGEFGIVQPVLTLSEQGIVALSGDKLLRSKALCCEVSDVTGAGDSVIAALAYALCSGACMQTALDFANAAAAITVARVGTHAPTLEQIAAIAPALVQRVLGQNSEKLGDLGKLASVGNFSKTGEFSEKLGDLAKLVDKAAPGKIISLEDACKMAAKHQRVVWTNGCFDILHAGHCSYLAAARALGDCLIVGLNSDESVRALKGPSRPVNAQNDRAAVLAALECVDAVVIFSEPTPLECIRALRPAVLAKGADYSIEQVIGREFAGEVALISFLEGRSSSKIIEKIKEAK